jgi:hypothetical protein
LNKGITYFFLEQIHNLFEKDLLREVIPANFTDVLISAAVAITPLLITGIIKEKI